MPTKKIEVSKDILEKEINSGISLTNIAKKLGYSVCVITRLCKKYGLKSSVYCKPNIEKEWLLQQTVDLKRSLEDIAKELGCAATTVRAAGERFGLSQEQLNIGKYRINKKPRIANYKVSKEWLEEQLKTDKSYVDIGKLVGSSRTMIAVWIKKYNIKVDKNRQKILGKKNRKKRQYQPYYIDIPKETLIDLYVNKKMSSVDIGNILRCGMTIVLNHLRKYNIPIRRKYKYSRKNNCPQITDRVDISGQRNGKLEVMVTNRICKDVYWECLCDCGTKVYIKTQEWLSKMKKDCGKCTRNTTVEKYGDIPYSWFNRLGRAAKNRKLSFEITIEDVWNIYIKQNKKCAFTGDDVIFDSVRGRQTASIDRIDSGLGYTKDNIQIIRKECNIMKQNYTDEFFISICKKVANFRG